MSCFCFRKPDAVEVDSILEEPRTARPSKAGAPQAPRRAEESSAGPSQAHSKEPRGLTPAGDGTAKAPVDRESPVSVLSGPGDDVSSDQRKPQPGEQEHHPQNPQQHQQLQESDKGKKDEREREKEKERKQREKDKEKAQEAVSRDGHSQRQPPPGASPLAGALADQRRKSEQRDESPAPRGRSSGEKDRDQKPVDTFERQRQKQQLQQQQQQLRGGGSSSSTFGVGSSYATALPGKSRILAWLDEAEFNFATVVEADNLPCPVAGEQSPLSRGSFLSALRSGHYDDLASRPVTKEVLLKRGMQRASLLPDSEAAPDTAGGGAPGEATAAPTPAAMAGAKAARQAPLAPDSGSAAGGAGGGGPRSGMGAASSGTSQRLRMPMHFSGPQPMVCREGASATMEAGTAAAAAAGAGAGASASAAGAGAGSGTGVGTGAGAESSGRVESSQMMQSLMKKTASLLRQRSLDADGRTRLGGVAAGMDTAAAAAAAAGGRGGGAGGRGGGGGGAGGGVHASAARGEAEARESGNGATGGVGAAGSGAAAAAADRGAAASKGDGSSNETQSGGGSGEGPTKGGSPGEGAVHYGYSRGNNLPSAPLSPANRGLARLMPNTPEQRHSAAGGSWAVMSPAGGLAGSTTDMDMDMDMGSGGQGAPTGDALSDLGRDSDAETGGNSQ